MIKTITQHIPSSIETNKDLEVYYFESLEDLLNNALCTRFKRDNFYQFSFSKQVSSNFAGYLVAEYKNGAEWWVVGYFNKEALPIAEQLPLWAPPKGLIDA